MKERIADSSYLTPRELADALGVSARTIRRLRAKGIIPCLFVTVSTPRYRLEDVVAALEGSEEVMREK